MSVIVRQLLHGINFLHKERRNLHRDMKPGNVLLSSNGFVKVADFGISRSMENTMVRRPARAPARPPTRPLPRRLAGGGAASAGARASGWCAGGRLPRPSACRVYSCFTATPPKSLYTLPRLTKPRGQAIASTFTGTAIYMAPERMEGKAYSFPADIWAIGLIVSECAVGRYPYALREDMKYFELVMAIVNKPAPLPGDTASPELNVRRPNPRSPRPGCSAAPLPSRMPRRPRAGAHPANTARRARTRAAELEDLREGRGVSD